MVHELSTSQLSADNIGLQQLKIVITAYARSVIDWYQ